MATLLVKLYIQAESHFNHRVITSYDVDIASRMRRDCKRRLSPGGRGDRQVAEGALVFIHNFQREALRIMTKKITSQHRRKIMAWAKRKIASELGRKKLSGFLTNPNTQASFWCAKTAWRQNGQIAAKPHRYGVKMRFS